MRGYPGRMGASTGTRTLNWACGLLATALAVAVLPPALFNAIWAYGLFSEGMWLFGAYNAVVALLFLAVPVVFLRAYDRWQTRKGLQ